MRYCGVYNSFRILSSGNDVFVTRACQSGGATILQKLKGAIFFATECSMAHIVAPEKEFSHSGAVAVSEDASWSG
jgi:hypothetical protein